MKWTRCCPVAPPCPLDRTVWAAPTHPHSSSLTRLLFFFFPWHLSPFNSLYGILIYGAYWNLTECKLSKDRDFHLVYSSVTSKKVNRGPVMICWNAFLLFLCVWFSAHTPSTPSPVNHDPINSLNCYQQFKNQITWNDMPWERWK